MAAVEWGLLPACNFARYARRSGRAVRGARREICELRLTSGRLAGCLRWTRSSLMA